MKGKSEPKFREALNDVELPLLIYKPPDDARNWKPCDYMTWWLSPTGAELNAAWFEVKECKAQSTFPFTKELRPSQRSGILDAAATGFPYYLAVWWKARGGIWTISRALPLIELEREMNAPLTCSFSELAGKYGIDAPQHSLASTLRAVLEGGI